VTKAKVTFRGMARNASQRLMSRSTGKISKIALAIALFHTKWHKKVLSKRATSAAFLVLKDGITSIVSKFIAGSVWLQGQS
jgi:hypothetical protein